MDNYTNVGADNFGTNNVQHRQLDVRQAVNASGQTGKKKINPTLVKLIVRSAYALVTLAVLTLGVFAGHHWGMRASEPSEQFYSDSMPNVIYVQGVRWYISKGEQDQELDLISAYGVTDCKRHIILIHSGMTLTGERDTLLHEILHAGVCVGESPDNHYWLSEDGHATIAKVSQFLVPLFIANPELAKYIFEMK